MRRRDLLLATVGVLLAWQAAALVIDRPVLPPPWDELTISDPSVSATRVSPPGVT